MKLSAIAALAAVILALICCAFSLKAFKIKSVAKTPVTFYKIPLVCSAAPDIGCGSKAKPVLKQLEENSKVSQAWLNHAGTVIAVVWKENADKGAREESTLAIFKEQNMDVELVLGKDYDHLLNNFNLKKNWLRHADVDQLSMIEADEISTRLVARVNAKKPLDKELASALKTDIENVFKKKFSSLNVTNINKQSEAATNIIVRSITEELLAAGKKHLNEKQITTLQDAITLGLQPVEGEPGYTKDGCCSKPNNAGQKCETNKKNEKKGCCSKESSN